MSRTVFHPTWPDVTREVDEADASKWKDAGWRLTEPKQAATVAPKADDSK